jgi:hypothetical protein
MERIFQTKEQYTSKGSKPYNSILYSVLKDIKMLERGPLKVMVAREAGPFRENS